MKDRTAEKERRKELYSHYIGHQAAIDKKNHSPIEFRFKEIYGKWPSALELQQARRYLKLRPADEEE